MSKKQEDKKRKKDIDFLQDIKDSSIEELKFILGNYQHKSAPAWKRVAILRAINKKILDMTPPQD